MTTHHQNGGRNSAPEDNDRSSWRPDDQSQKFSGSAGRANDDDRDYRSWRDRNFRDDEAARDPRRWEGSRGSEVGYGGPAGDRDAGRRPTEYYGQGQSGYSAGRYGDDRSQQMRNRNEMVSGTGRGGSHGYGGGYDDRYRSSGPDDRFGDRGAWSYSQDRGGYGQDRYGAPGSDNRGSESERHAPWSSYGHDETLGYHGENRGGQRMGHQAQGPQGYRGASQGYRDEREPHVHAGSGPHRGKGPSGYQRSDERLRELISESLADDDHLDASHIEVTVKNGDVVLTGWVDDRRAKRDAEDCAAGVSGVRDVQNQLRVQDDRRGKMLGAGHTTGGSAAAAASYGTPNARVDTESASQDKKHRA